MKRLHINLAVSDLDRSVAFYSTLFGADPTVLKPDYAKWMLDDPRVNFAISDRAERKGIDHLGIQVEGRDDLDAIQGRLEEAAAPLVDQGETTCCYARSEKTWSFDPEGIAWETFFSLGDSPVYGSDSDQTASNCCDTPSPAETVDAAPACCAK